MLSDALSGLHAPAHAQNVVHAQTASRQNVSYKIQHCWNMQRASPPYMPSWQAGLTRKASPSWYARKNIQNL